MCLKYFVEAGAMAVRRVLKRDLKRIAKASGGMSSASSQIKYLTLIYVTVSKVFLHWNIDTKLQKLSLAMFGQQVYL
jgi:di/tricarboxylate transporter